jgi:regulatory protein RepA
MPIDILKCYQTEPPPLDFVLPSLLSGTVGSIVSPGGQGKSMLALQLAHHISGFVDMLGLGEYPIGRVVYLSAEDGGNILHHRLYEIGGRLGKKEREECAARLIIEDLTKYTPDLLHGDKAEAWRTSIERAATNSRLLLLDTLRGFHSGDENDSQAMAVLMGHLRAIAARTDCAIVFLHHTSKALAVSGQGDLQQASRGSSVLTDNIRWQAYLAGMTTEESKSLSAEDGAEPIGEEKGYYVRFGISKQNYGAPFTEKWFRRGKGGILEPATLKPASGEGSSKGRRSN